MKLLLYSGFSEQNSLDDELKTALNAFQHKSLTIFLSNSDDFKSKYVYPITDYYKRCGFNDVSVCLYSQTNENTNKISAEYPDIKFIGLDSAFESDAIFLSGGSNYYFQNSLRKNNKIGKLQDYARSNHLLIGMSAGSMLMQKDIKNSEIPSYDPEPNPVGDISLESLNLIPFYFFPHYDGDTRFLSEVKEFSNKTKDRCYICTDNDGLYIEGNNVVLKGNTIEINPQ